MRKLQTIAILLLLCLAAGSLCGCSGSSGSTDPDGAAIKLSFKAATGYDELKKLDGKTVTINGYMATSSPVDGSFLFLMNLPYQSCPFCKPNTSQLSNTMEVYPKNGKRFEYTAQAIAVTGKLMVAASETESFTDAYGYEFNFKIVDAEYRMIRAEELGAQAALWQRIAESDLVSDLYTMYDYVNFTCAWNGYFVNSYENANGETVPGYYLYAADALHYLQEDGAQWNFGYREGYFDKLIQKASSLDGEALQPLISNIEEAKALATKAVEELEAGNYTYELQYVEKFGKEDYIYTINEGEALQAEFERLYLAFTDWLGSWEL